MRKIHTTEFYKQQEKKNTNDIFVSFKMFSSTSGWKDYQARENIAQASDAYLSLAGEI